MPNWSSRNVFNNPTNHCCHRLFLPFSKVPSMHCYPIRVLSPSRPQNILDSNFPWDGKKFKLLHLLIPHDPMFGRCSNDRKKKRMFTFNLVHRDMCQKSHEVKLQHKWFFVHFTMDRRRQKGEMWKFMCEQSQSLTGVFACLECYSGS